jgi:hypothetical protein
MCISSFRMKKNSRNVHSVDLVLEQKVLLNCIKKNAKWYVLS